VHRYVARLIWDGRENADYAATVASIGCSWPASRPRRHTFRGGRTGTIPGPVPAAISGCHMLSYLALCARKGDRVLAYGRLTAEW
jgi:organic hydroperoxide reductase OsmC/OhrA